MLKIVLKKKYLGRTKKKQTKKNTNKRKKRNKQNKTMEEFEFEMIQFHARSTLSVEGGSCCCWSSVRGMSNISAKSGGS